MDEKNHGTSEGREGMNCGRCAEEYHAQRHSASQHRPDGHQCESFREESRRQKCLAIRQPSTALEHNCGDHRDHGGAAVRKDPGSEPGYADQPQCLAQTGQHNCCIADPDPPSDQSVWSGEKSELALGTEAEIEIVIIT